MRIGRILTGLLVVALGIVLLLNNYGLVEWSIWLMIGKLWPILLIIFGIAVFFDKSVLPVGLIILILAVVFGIAAPMTTSETYVRSGVDQHSWEIGANITEADFKLDYGAGDLSIKESSQNMVEFDIKYAHRKPQIKHEIKGNKAYYKIESAKGSFISGFGKAGIGELNLLLSPEVIWEMEMNIGAANVDLDFSQIKLRNLEVDCGASDLNLNLGNYGFETQIDIDAGASNIKIVVPEDVSLQVKLDGALSSSNLEAVGLIRKGDFYITPDTVGSDSLIKVNLDTGVSNLELVRSQLY